MLGQMDTRMRVGQVPTLGDQIFHVAAPEPFPQRLSHLETQIRLLHARVAELEGRMPRARWQRLRARWLDRYERLGVWLAARYRYLRMRWR